MATENNTAGLLSSSVGRPFAFLGGLGNSFAQIMAGKKAQKGEKDYRGTMEELLSQHGADVEGLLAGDAFRNYMETEQAQSMLEQVRRQLQQNAKQTRGSIARSGGTDEAAIASQGSVNQGYADVINRLAGHGTQYNQIGRQRLFQGRRGLSEAKGTYASNLYSMNNDQANRISQQGQSFSNSMVGLGESYTAEAEGLLKLFGL